MSVLAIEASGGVRDQRWDSSERRRCAGSRGAVGDAPLAGGESLKMDVSGASGGKG